MATRETFPTFCLAICAVLLVDAASIGAQAAPDLTGHWTLNRALSQFPRELGFGVNFQPAAIDQDPSAGAGRARRGAGTARAFPRPESADDAVRVRQLTDEVREPPAGLTITDAPSEVTISDDHGHSRAFHPSGREELIDLGSVKVVTIARREAGQFVVLYEVEEGRQIRYDYTRADNPTRLIVDVQFIDHGAADKVTRIYEPATASKPPASPGGPSSAPATGASPGSVTPGPGAEFKGLSTLGIVVEELSAQSTSCGLNQRTLDEAVSKRLSDAGLQVHHNSDEDTYVYVNINTATISNGLCVSRYDVSLTTHTTAKLSYQDTPVLVEVSLMHKGSMAGGEPRPHADGVTKGILDYVDQIVGRIREANK